MHATVTQPNTATTFAQMIVSRRTGRITSSV